MQCDSNSGSPVQTAGFMLVLNRVAGYDLTPAF